MPFRRERKTEWSPTENAFIIHTEEEQTTPGQIRNTVQRREEARESARKGEGGTWAERDGTREDRRAEFDDR